LLLWIAVKSRWDSVGTVIELPDPVTVPVIANDIVQIGNNPRDSRDR